MMVVVKTRVDRKEKSRDYAGTIISLTSHNLINHHHHHHQSLSVLRVVVVVVGGYCCR